MSTQPFKENNKLVFVDSDNDYHVYKHKQTGLLFSLSTSDESVVLVMDNKQFNFLLSKLDDPTNWYTTTPPFSILLFLCIDSPKNVHSDDFFKRHNYSRW